MPNLQHSPLLTAEAVRSYLANVLPSSNLSVRRLDDAHEPLVLLRTDHIAAGFGFSNGDVERSYELAYHGFKHLFNQQKGLWDALDLAFVFCVLPSFPNLDQFCSNVETDVFFCRKFVVPVAQSIDSSLARLPFLPLAPVEGRTLRPASAQTFLQQSGVSPVLSKYIVVQRERGAERIIEDCIRGEFGTPVALSAPNPAPISEIDGERETVRLEEITIKNFRAYREPRTLRIGAGITVLYGPNGFGKTSFFDAVDFAVTGGIGRRESLNESHFAKTARHLDAGSEESTVTLTLRSKDAPRKLVRNVKNRKDALLDGHSTDRKTVLSELTGREIAVSDRVDNFINLFRATHLFNQELQELTKDFQHDCCLPPEIVSRMLAFQDYTNALAKTGRVCDVLNEIIKVSQEEIGKLRDEIADGTKELNRLKQASNGGIDPASVNIRFEELKRRLKHAGLTPDPSHSDVATLRRWRVLIEEKSGEVLTRISRLTELAKELPVLIRCRADLAATGSQISEKEQALVKLEAAQTSAEAVVGPLERSVLDVKTKLSALNAQQQLFDWYRVSRPVYLDLLGKQQGLRDELNRSYNEIEELRVADQKAAANLRSLEDQSNRAFENLKLRRKELDTLNKLLERIPSWQRAQNSLTDARKLDDRLQYAIEALQNEAKTLDQQLANLTRDEQRLAQQVEQIDRTQSKFKALLFQLQGHVTSGTCPLCGDDHGTQQELLGRIQNQLRGDPASVQRRNLTDVREKTKLLREALAESHAKFQSALSQQSVLKQLRETSQADIMAFDDAAMEAGIVIEGSALKPEGSLQAKVLQLVGEIEKLEGEIKDSSEALQHARNTALAAKNLLNANLRDENGRKALLAQYTQEVDNLKADQRWPRLPLDSPSETVRIEEKDAHEIAARFSLELTAKQSELEQKKFEFSMRRREATTMRNQLQTLGNQNASLQKRIAEINAKIEGANLSLAVTEENVQSLISQETSRYELVGGLRDAAENLEIVLDAATTAAALGTLQETIRNKQKALDQIKEKRDRHTPWVHYFETVSRLLSSHQNKAIASFTDEYGPRTSVIQRRLRSVYGFDDVQIHTRDSKIQVRVKRHGEELRPTDYFSQSQQQTLLLGLFLTACISQTWSGFSPVLMDDPVTHFDDLNTYAFLDLIVGLLSSDSRKRQFIISTCDEKLLHLAMQKFRHLGEGAVFYRFDAIGEHGPIVSRIATE